MNDLLVIAVEIILVMYFIYGISSLAVGLKNWFDNEDAIEEIPIGVSAFITGLAVVLLFVL